MKRRTLTWKVQAVAVAALTMTLLAPTAGARAQQPSPGSAAPARSVPPATPSNAPAPPVATATPVAPVEIAPAPADARRLTLGDVVQIAERGSFDVRAARARLDQAAVSVAQAWANLLPNLAAQGKYTHNYKEVSVNFSSPTATLPPVVIQKQEQLDASLNATVPLLVPWAWFQLGSARQSVSAAQSTFEAARATAMLAVAQAFYLAAGSDELLVARQHAVEVARKTLDNAAARVDAGTANRVDVLRAQVAHEQALQALADADASRRQAYRGLATAAAIEGAFVVDAGALPADRFAGEDPGRLALKLRPEFAQAERTIEANRLAARSNLWRWAPTVSAFGNLRAFNYAGFSGDSYAWAAGVQLDWLLYEGGLRDAQRKLALAQNAEQAALLDKLRLTVRDEVENARAQVDVKRRGVDTAARAVELSRQSLELSRVQYQSGTATQLDLLTAQDQLISNEVQLARARFDLSLADVQLQRAAGTFPAPPVASN